MRGGGCRGVLCGCGVRLLAELVVGPVSPDRIHHWRSDPEDVARWWCLRCDSRVPRDGRTRVWGCPGPEVTR